MNKQERIIAFHDYIKEKLKSGDFVLIPSAMSQEDFRYMIAVFQFTQTIMYYEKHYISRDAGLRGLPTIWAYLCATLNETDENYNKDYYDEVVEHRRTLGFPVDKDGFPKINARTFERLVAGEKVKNCLEILEEFYQNENFLKIYWESRKEFTNLENVLNYPKVLNKMEQIIETSDRIVFSKQYGKKFSSKKDFIRWRCDNLKEYKDIISSKSQSRKPFD
ncbi:hypothetical protein NKE60_09285 [Streptococcus suis]|uniref:hypothetical protein n=1 Tax=Streptococcus suis TaxID=1307 RepID=UPI00209B5E7B|nr:hypothetical protein [Streptococcus suis]MCO8184897.1 hypothetical protein [Streptococcus suis]MCO8216463.1 hypothetical protein [Streptococcus suis]HEM3496686.1 hypothetical protein [Streptococcus suis]HEM3509870.1 hypothetical protein [Streptococcus suis]